MIEYRNKTGVTRVKPELGLDIVEENFDDNQGWCVACGNLQEGCEPDARKYECDTCGEKTVYGLTELALMGLVAPYAG